MVVVVVVVVVVVMVVSVVNFDASEGEDRQRLPREERHANILFVSVLSLQQP